MWTSANIIPTYMSRHQVSFLPQRAEEFAQYTLPEISYYRHLRRTQALEFHMPCTGREDGVPLPITAMARGKSPDAGNKFSEHFIVHDRWGVGEELQSNTPVYPFMVCADNAAKRSTGSGNYMADVRPGVITKLRVFRGEPYKDRRRRKSYDTEHRRISICSIEQEPTYRQSAAPR